LISFTIWSTGIWEEPLGKAKPFNISKRVVFEAYHRVKANKGAAGVDGESIADFDKNLKNNLYKIWNRMSSGSYFPPAVLFVEIAKKGGGLRKLGVPTVSDRIAQMVAKMYFEPSVDPVFHPDSYGYRPGKSAIEALGVARERCWRYRWVVDLDIKGFFDNIDHELLMRAVRKHTDSKWLLLYIERWLKAPVQTVDGTLVERGKGSPQGSVISPLLANLFLHYAFDEWMRRNFETVPFERYADDILVHCKSEKQAKWIKAVIEKRLKQCRLELHPEKTKIVFCGNPPKGGNYPNEKFDFLGYTFRLRRAKGQNGKFFVTFLPAVSNDAAKSIRDTIRSWRLHRMTDKSLKDLANMFNPIIRGWVNYYGQYYKSALHPILNQLNGSLQRWAMRKYKKLHRRKRKAFYFLGRIAKQTPYLFAHWRLVRQTAGR
jgi:RNA-directed DNA polymerase